MWAEKFMRDEDGKLCVQTVDLDGERAKCSINELTDLSLKTDSDSIRITTNFSDWKKCRPTIYLALADFPQGIDESHSVFEIESNGIRYLIPALVLMHAFFRPKHKVFPDLFSPAGLERLCIPMKGVPSDVEFLDMRLHSPTTADGRTRASPYYTEGHRRTLAWMWSFPSANKFWNSIFRHALCGLISADLPLGTLSAIFRGRRTRQYFLVTEIRLRRLATDECPFEFAANSLTNFDLNDVGPRLGSTECGGITLSSTINLHDNGDWALTDNEWSDVSAIIESGKTHCREGSKFDLRPMIDALIRKIGCGIAWQKTSFPDNKLNLARFYYRKWLKDGRWDAIVNCLNKVR
ncbi:transposase [Undibacterium terreum]|uniref:transposase n=1 Tax=Undibacterium terreum TaxID=1224302 RepID=UPI001666DC28|nr:transposase [Undibacterium terreum]